MNFDDYQNLDFDLADNGVLLVTINRNPERFNAVDERLHYDLSRVWLDIDADPDVRVTVITGKGRAFSAGGDIEMENRVVGDYQRITRVLKVARDLVLNIVNCDKPVISAINGPAAGAGLAIALMADISLIAEGVRFTDGHTRIGVAAGDHATMIWPLLCGMAKAKYYLLTSARIDATEAERIGLVTKCVPGDSLLAEAMDIANDLAGGPQLAIQWTKRSLNHWLRLAQPTFEASLALEMMNFFGPDIREGLDAFAEKRPPEFT